MIETPRHGEDARFEEVLAAYLEAVDSGWAPARRAFIERYPAWRDRLETFFAASDEVTQIVVPVRGETPAPGASQLTVLLDGAGGNDTLPRPFGDYDLLQMLGRGGMGVV